MNTRNFDHSSDIVMELKAGGANAGILDKPAADYFVTTDGKGAFRVVDVPDSKVSTLPSASTKDNKELQQEVNAAIAKLKKDGTLNKLHEKWFNTPARICLPQQKKHWESSNIKTSLQKGCVPNGSHPFLIANSCEAVCRWLFLSGRPRGKGVRRVFRGAFQRLPP